LHEKSKVKPIHAIPISADLSRTDLTSAVLIDAHLVNVLAVDSLMLLLALSLVVF
jgi:uncharacterized protein YjbI with pentapeptide repeats